MARRLGKKKMPAREDKPFKEHPKIAHKVFDDSTVSVLVHFLNNGTFDSVDYPVASGKESIVFRATSGKGHVAVKIFKYETSAFHNFAQYIEGDPRFHLKNTHRELVKLWARKENANLKKASEARVRVPEPITQRENVVVMEFLGEGGVPFPLLEEIVVDDPKAIYKDVLENARKTYAARLVHADLSSFNIMHYKKAYLIDWAQAVLLEHPRAEEFLERDARNIAQFFNRNGLGVKAEDVLKEIKGK
ncbi:serine protein kinase RIO [Candidatus Micrarchaeota archaeon]|nr:serine protein kinase RIO [Candidatus Micrarchaeota archaeon]